VTAPVRERPRVSVVPTGVPAAGSAHVAALLQGPPRRVEVLATGPHAVYLSDRGDHRGCLAVLGRDAVAVPVGLRTALPTLARPTTATVGDGAVHLDGLTVRLARVVSTTVPRLPGLPDAGAHAVRPWLRPGHDPRLDAATAQLPPSAAEALARGDVTGLVGLGDGFTPVGDDVVCGWLVTRHALGRPADVPIPLQRTTPVSAAFLERAAAGEAIPPLRELLVRLAADSAPAELHHRLDDLLQVGSSSGAGLAIGAALALIPFERTS
jgi:hypothetical protein